MILEGDDPVMHLAPNIVQEQWYIVEGVCVPREELTIVADPNPFPAPGGDKCSVTVTPFVPCTLLVNDTPYALTEADPTLELGASVPTTFLIFLQELTGYWATPLAIQAM
jgi:hypothetical protein